MNNFHKTLFLISIFISTVSLAQNTENKLDGIWYNEEKGLLFEIKENDIYKIIVQDGEYFSFENFQKAQGLTFNKKSQQLGNNAFYTWSATCDDCKWTETQFTNFSILDTDTLYFYWKRIVNNRDVDNPDKECFSEGGKCFSQEDTGKLVRHEE